MTALFIAVPVLWLVLKYLIYRLNRRQILCEKPHLDDVAYLSLLPWANNKKESDLALKIRNALATLTKLPQECIVPDQIIEELFYGYDFSNSAFNDGLDVLDFLDDLEENLKIGIMMEPPSVWVTDKDTVMTLTNKLMEVFITDRPSG